MTGPTAQITVLRCQVTVVRRGGWSWGPDPRGLVQQVLDTVPDLLTARFASVLEGDGPDIEITEPVTLDVRLGPDSWPGGGSPADVVSSPIEVSAAAEPVSAVAEEFAEERVWTPQTVAGFFAELAERGELAAVLASLPDASVLLYARTLMHGAESTVVDAVLARLGLATVDDLPVPDEVTREPLVEVRAAKAETQVWSVLPFLLAGPLARTGYLDAVGPALAGVQVDASLFAAALAYKVLGVVERGWRRQERDHEVAAAFAGLEPVPDLVSFARQVRPALPVLDSVLALSLCRGHDFGLPLVLTGVDDHLLLVDSQGTFPIAWAADVAGIVPHWEACGRPPVLVCTSSLPSGCFRDLAAAGIPFLTDVRPLRGDPGKRLPWRSPLWTHGVSDVRLAAELPEHAARVADLVQALVVERPAVPPDTGGDLDRSLTLAAGLGLGTIAWMLWRDRETPDPVLALRRFTDLDGMVRFSPEAVHVRVPLGRRHADLLRAGLLADVSDVVWLGGRTLTFSGG
ncbi:hypothetical protein [Actinocrispum sp. NPDC049592]|uniref:hypothetical protein n=1 Tax=Actinocrispum sp. NPDC049592 TaxID=3154835 RepID=UPI003439C7AC